MEVKARETAKGTADGLMKEGVVQALQRAGYKTAQVGKWHMGNDPTPRPGFDFWVSFPGQGRINDPDIYENGKLGKVKARRVQVSSKVELFYGDPLDKTGKKRKP